MFSNSFFAVTQLNVDPDITKAGLFIYAVLFITAIGMILRHVIPAAFRSYREHRQYRAEANRNIWFDIKRSVLHRNNCELELPENSLEYFVCKLVFEEPGEPQSDYNIIEAAEKDPINDRRSVEQAVRRVNKKAKGALELKGDLLLRRKEKTFLNDIERLI